MKKTAIPSKARKLVMQETGGVCAFCEERDVATLEIHHIEGRDIEDPHKPENLIYVCGNCHAKITCGDISEADVKVRKRFWQWMTQKLGRKSSSAPSQTVHIVNSTNTAPITNTVVYRTSSNGKPKVPPPEGVICTDANRRNYVKRLIDRYNEFASENGKRVGFKYPAIYSAIKGQFKTTWEMVPIVHFERLVAYLHRRIDRTKLACFNRSKGHRSYLSFHEYVSQFGIPAQ